MGHRVTQRILECGICCKTPEDGEYLWEMNGQHWCQDCCDEAEEAEEIPQFQGTKESLDHLALHTESK